MAKIPAGEVYYRITAIRSGSSSWPSCSSSGRTCEHYEAGTEVPLSVVETLERLTEGQFATWEDLVVHYSEHDDREISRIRTQYTLTNNGGRAIVTQKEI